MSELWFLSLTLTPSSSLTPQQVNDNSFGASISVEASQATSYVAAMQMTVYFTARTTIRSVNIDSLEQQLQLEMLRQIQALLPTERLEQTTIRAP
jgi:hypothetical protein